MTQLTWWQWTRLRLVELTVALLLASLVIEGASRGREMQRDLVPVSDWLAVNEVFVPDHPQGTDPQVIYDRTIKEPVRGFWVVEIQNREVENLSFTECSGAGVNDYETTDIIPGGTVSLSWLVGKNCGLKPGRYRLRLSYDVTRPGWSVKSFVVLSNTFTVSAAP